MMYRLTLEEQKVLHKGAWDTFKGYQDVVETNYRTIVAKTPEELVQKLADEFDIAIEINKPNDECGAV